MTNGDKIRAMTDDELAMLLNPTCPPRNCPEGRQYDPEKPNDCLECWKEWLKQEVTP